VHRLDDKDKRPGSASNPAIAVSVVTSRARVIQREQRERGSQWVPTYLPVVAAGSEAARCSAIAMSTRVAQSGWQFRAQQSPAPGREG